MKSTLMLLTAFFLFSCASSSHSSKAVNDAEALMEKGQMVEANMLLTNACNQKDVGACIYLGKVSELVKDTDSAKKYYELACNANSGYSCHKRGVFEILSEKQDIEKTKYFFIKGCDINDSLSCYLLGDLSYEVKNLKEANMYFKKSCDLGIKLACEKLQGIDVYKPRTNEQKLSDNMLAKCQSGQTDACKSGSFETSRN